MNEIQNGHATREGWRHASLGKLLPIKYGKSLPAQLRDPDGTHPVYGSSGMVGTHSAALTTGPTLIVGRKGNVGAVHYSSVPCWPIDTAYFVETPSGHNLLYYKYLLESLNLVKLDRSTAIPGLSRDDYNAVEVSIAPPAKQDEIVAELEKQFSRLDEAVANLQRVKANLKRYKASVLKDAVEGRLVPTEAELACREGRSFETGEQLLRQILEARRKEWKGRGKYREPEAPIVTELSILPEGWGYATAEQMCDPIASGSTPAPAAMHSGDGEVPFLKVYNLTFDGSLDFTVKPTFVKRETHDGMLARSRSFPGDVLMNIVGPPLGKISIVPDWHPEWNINQAIVTFRTSVGLLNQLLAYWLMSTSVLSRLERTAKATAGQSNLQVSTCRHLPLPIPPMAEQGRIVAEVDRRLSLVRGVEAEVESSLVRAKNLRQAVLTKCFSY